MAQLGSAASTGQRPLLDEERKSYEADLSAGLFRISAPGRRGDVLSSRQPRQHSPNLRRMPPTARWCQDAPGVERGSNTVQARYAGHL
jgi:hypothetical protein